MTDTLRVILEIGRKRRVVAGALDWPGLDRWGTVGGRRPRGCLAYVPRYVAVAERAGLGAGVRACPRGGGGRTRARLKLDRFLGHRARTVADRARGPARRAIWNGGSSSCGPAGPLRRGRGSRLGRTPPRRHAAPGAAATRSSATSTTTSRSSSHARWRSARRGEVVLTAGRPGDASAGLPRRHPRLQRRRQAGAELADPVPRAPDRASRHGSRLGDGGPRPRRHRLIRRASQRCNSKQGLSGSSW